MAGIGVGEVPAETSGGSVQVAGPDRQVKERDSIAIGGQMSPGRTEDPELGELVLARHVQRERRRERAPDLDDPDRVAKGGADLPLTHTLRNDEQEVRKPESSSSFVHPAASRR